MNGSLHWGQAVFLPNAASDFSFKVLPQFGHFVIAGMDHSGPNKRGATNVTSPAGTVYDVIHTFDLPRNLQRLRQPYLNTVQLEFSDQFFPPQRPKSLPHSLVRLPS